MKKILFGCGMMSVHFSSVLVVGFEASLNSDIVSELRKRSIARANCGNQLQLEATPMQRAPTNFKISFIFKREQPCVLLSSALRLMGADVFH